MDGNTTPPINELGHFSNFLIFCIITVVIVVLYLFFFNRLVAFLLSYFLRLYIWRKHRAYISIESIQFGILAGRILFKNIHYVGENMSLSILQGHVTFRYWLKAVRGHTATTNMDPPTSQVDEDLPCRIICILEGVEVFIYNNTETYRDAKRQLDPEQEPEERTSERTPTQSSRETELDKIRKYLDSSIFLKLLPIQIDCRVGAIVIGNSRLESLLTIEFSEGGGVYTATRAKSLLDYYQSQLFMKLGRVRVSLREHADYGQIDKTWRNYTNMARQKRGWFQRWCLCNSIEATEEDTSEYEMTPNLKHAAYDSLTNKEMQYAAVADVLECSQLDILYYSDVVGTVPPLDQHLSIENDKIGNGDIAPEWGLQLAITNSLIQYGPWADNQRGQLQDFFYPAIYRNQRVTPFLQHNDPRMHTAFNLNIQFMGDTNFRIPTREPSKDWLHVSEPRQSPTHPRGAAAARPYGWLDLQMAPDSSLSVVVPSIVDDIGYTTKVELYMRNVDITTSVDYASLLLASECRFVGYMESPRIWNAKRLWTYSVSVNKPEIFLLRDHITLVVDLINDWTAGPPADMAHFIPMAYEYHISLSDLKLRMCVNEHNVINQTNDFDENAFITLSTPIFALEFKSQFFDYLPQEVSMPFQIKVADAGLSMDLPSLDTNGAFLSEEARHCLSVGILELGGSFEYHPQVDVDHVDCLTLRIKVDDVTGRLFGFIIRYIIILADNYFGEYVDFTTTDDYRNGLNDTTSRRLRVRRRQASKPASNQFEVHVIAVITRGFLFLPETLYSLGERPLLLEFDELQVDNRNVSFYQDLFISSSPIKLSRGSPAMSGRRTQASAARSMWERTECIYLDELSIHGHRLFGPMPNTLTYVCHWEIDLGQLSGRVRPALLEAVVSAVQRLDYQMDDFENALPHQLSPSGYPDVTFLRVGVRQIDLTIWGSQETATQLLISEGIRVEFQNLIGEKYSKKTLVAVPQVILRSLAATKSNANDPAILPAETLIWTEVAYVETSIDFTAYTHTSDWYEKREQQRNFIHDQDRETRRCAFLYSSDTDTIHEALGDELTRPDHQGALYIPPFQPSFADDDSTVLAIHRHSLQSYSTGQYSAGSQSFPVERDISDHEQDISGSDSDSGVEEEEEGRVDERGEHLNLLTSPSRYSLSNRSKLSRRSSAVESFRTAWESRHSRSTYEGRDVDDNDSDIEDELNDDEALLYSPDEDVLLDAPSKPLSIPYHKYLRRFQIERSWQPGGNGHIYIKPPLTRFNPEMDQEETITDESWRPPFYDMWREFVRDHYDSTTINYFEDGEHRSAFVIDMQRSVDLLVTPVFLRIVGDLLESLDSEDRSPDKLLDSLHIGYMSRGRPCIHLNAIQDVALPADLTSYDGYSNHRTLYDLSGTLLCAAEVILDAFTLRLTQQTVEASKDLPQLKLNVSLGSVRSNLRFVSSSDFTGITGIPGVMCSIEPSTTVQQQDSGRNEPVVVSCSADDISIQLSGGGTLEDRLVLDMQSISATCVHQAIEIVAGAAVSWLSFVDQLERILKPFAARWSARDRLLVAALAESSAKEVMPGGDAAFLTRPSIAWRLSPPAFQNDSGWWLLARLRHCAHSLSAIQINRVKQRIRSLDLQDRLRFEELYEATRRHLSTWIHWDNERDSRCYLLDKLFGRPIVTDARTSVSALPAGLRQQGLDLDTLLDRLAREKAGISYRLARIHVCIYEPKSENNIAIGPITANFESRRRDNHGDYSRWTPDAKLSILARFSVSQIDIDISPSMLSLIKHALEVQRSFSAYQPLNHFMYERDSLAQQQQRVNRPYSNDFTSRSSTAPVTTPTNNVTTMKWIEHLRRNITVQCFVSLQLMTITASAHNLLLRSQLSALHLTMLLTPFNTTNSNTPSSSPSTAVNMAVMSTISAMLRRFDVVIQELQIKPHSLRMKHPPTTLLEIELNRQSINGSAVLFDPLKSMTTLPDLLNVMGGLGGISIRIPQSLLKLYHFVEEWKTDNLPTYDFLLHRIRNEWKQTRKPATPVPMQVISTTPTESKDWLQLLASRLRVHLLIDTLTLHADTLPSLSGCYIARQLMLTMQPGQSQVVDIQGQIHDQKVKFSTRSTNTPQLLPSNDTISHGVFPIPAIRFGSRYRFKHNPASTSTSNNNSNNNNNQRDVTSMAKSRHKPIPPPISTTHNTTTTKTYAANTSNVNLLDVVVTVDFVDLVLDADLMDKVITIQGLLGNEVNDALEVFVAAKKRYSTSNTAIISQDTSPESNQGDISDKTTKNSGLGLYYSISVALLSARVTAVSPAAAMILESDVLRGYLTNHIETKPFSIDSEMYWKVVAKGLNLSLCHGSVVMASTWSRDKQWRHKRLAFILLDFKLQNFRERSSMKRSDHLPTDACARRIYICIDRAHAVMQPVALGKLVDFAIFYSRELSRRREAKAGEIQRLTDNTRRMLRSLDVELPKYKETGRSLLEDKSISIQVSRLTVAMPLVRDWEGGTMMSITSTSNSGGDTESSSHSHHDHLHGVPAFLISATAIDLLTRRWEASCGLLNNFYIQFVPRFNQSVEEHFDPAWHPRVNRVLLPALQCEVHAAGTRQMKQVWFDAWADGLEVDIDSQVVHHIGTLSAIWEYSRDRFEFLTIEALDTNTVDTDTATAPIIDTNTNNDAGESILLAIEARLSIDSGTCRFHPHLPRLLRHTPNSETNNNKHSTSSYYPSKRVSARFGGRTAQSSHPPLGASISTSTQQAASQQQQSQQPLAETNLRRNYDNCLVVPGLSLRTSVKLPLGSSHKNLEAAAAQRAHVDVHIHASENVLYPTLVPFIDELLSGLQSSLAQSSPQMTPRPLIIDKGRLLREKEAEAETSAMANTTATAAAISIPNMPISIYYDYHVLR
ncbi:hypothetical protein BDF19DRAFT_498830 [Syncephalis fuscata]|nr:hypothetical protein BDF19DRAFT_498830 [Syncephalis fuscata]